VVASVARYLMYHSHKNDYIWQVHWTGPTDRIWNAEPSTRPFATAALVMVLPQPHRQIASLSRSDLSVTARRKCSRAALLSPTALPTSPIDLPCAPSQRVKPIIHLLCSFLDRSDITTAVLLRAFRVAAAAQFAHEYLG
jgi:hypothetical protein